MCCLLFGYPVFQYAVRSQNPCPYARRVVASVLAIGQTLDYAFVVGLKLGLFPVGRNAWRATDLRWITPVGLSCCLCHSLRHHQALTGRDRDWRTGRGSWPMCQTECEGYAPTGSNRCCSLALQSACIASSAATHSIIYYGGFVH